MAGLLKIGEIRAGAYKSINTNFLTAKAKKDKK
jgi:hypothetical protein